MTVLAEVCTPPQVRRVDRYQKILDYPLSVSTRVMLLDFTWGCNLRI
jgi:hypothetical protein